MLTAGNQAQRAALMAMMADVGPGAVFDILADICEERARVYLALPARSWWRTEVPHRRRMHAKRRLWLRTARRLRGICGLHE